MIETSREAEQVILVAVEYAGGGDAEPSLDELAELVKTAGAFVLDRMVQRLPNIHPATYIGSGKVDELQMLIRLHDATGIVCDDELS
ncbi:MAG: GTPase HflX, partial [Lachnospiraceae bacterium]|nr:GTPase HflX [Lachnospiraceae bacterium]